MLVKSQGHFGPHRQRGATFLGMVTIIAILGFGLYGGIRLVPLYLEYMNVSRAMEQVRTEFNGEPTSAPEIVTALNRRWTIEDITRVAPEQIAIQRDGDVIVMHAAYRAEAPFIANVSLVVDFEKTVEIPQ
jgi:Domain of unknown function (DUF4845)